MPAVQRAGQRLRPGRRRDAGRAPGQQVGDQRPEGVDHQRAQGAIGACCWRAPTGTCPSTRASPTSSSTCSQPGVRGRIRCSQMNGHASFNQVFFTDAKVEPEFLVSDVGDGWKVATTTLMHERRGADGLRRWAKASERPGPHLRRGASRDRDRSMEPYKWYPQRAGRVDLMHRARQGDRQDRRSGGAPGDRQAADHVEAAPSGPRGAHAPRRSRGGRRVRRARSASWRRATSRAPPTRVHT